MISLTTATKMVLIVLGSVVASRTATAAEAGATTRKMLRSGQTLTNRNLVVNGDIQGVTIGVTTCSGTTDKFKGEYKFTVAAGQVQDEAIYVYNKCTKKPVPNTEIIVPANSVDFPVAFDVTLDARYRYEVMTKTVLPEGEKNTAIGSSTHTETFTTPMCYNNNEVDILIQTFGVTKCPEDGSEITLPGGTVLTPPSVQVTGCNGVGEIPFPLVVSITDSTSTALIEVLDMCDTTNVIASQSISPTTTSGMTVCLPNNKKYKLKVTNTMAEGTPSILATMDLGMTVIEEGKPFGDTSIVCDKEHLFGVRVIDNNWEMIGTGDFNGDGIDDLVWTHVPTQRSSIWTMAADGSGTIGYHGGWTALDPAGLGYKLLAIGDVNGDGTDDMLMTEAFNPNNSVGVYAWIIKDSHKVDTQVISNNPDYTYLIGDMNNDGSNDIVYFDPNDQLGLSGQIAYMTNTGSSIALFDSSVWYGYDYIGTKQNKLSTTNKAEAIFRDVATGNIYSWTHVNANPPTFINPTFENKKLVGTTSTSDDKFCGFGDVDNDGNIDYIFQNTTTGGTITIWLTDQSGNVIKESKQDAPTKTCVGVADINGDNLDDIIFQDNVNGGTSAWIF